jgi:hypothetical protein
MRTRPNIPTDMTTDVVAVLTQDSETFRVRVFLQPSVESHAFTSDASMNPPTTGDVIDGQNAEVVEATARTIRARTTVVPNDVLSQASEPLPLKRELVTFDWASEMIAVVTEHTEARRIPELLNTSELVWPRANITPVLGTIPVHMI